MATDNLKSWVDCLRSRRYADLSTAVWDLLWLAAQHRTFQVRPRAAAGLEFTLDGQEPRAYPLGDNVGWLRALLARMASLLKDRGAIEAVTCHHGFKARIKMPDSAGTDRSFEIEMKNNQREGYSLAVRRLERPPEPAPPAAEVEQAAG